MCATTSVNSRPTAKRGDYVRVKYLDNTSFIVEGDLARGKLKRYKLSDAEEPLRHD